MMAEAVHDEEDAQSAYESFVQETNKSITAKNRDIVNKKAARATAERGADKGPNALALLFRTRTVLSHSHTPAIKRHAKRTDEAYIIMPPLRRSPGSLPLLLDSSCSDAPDPSA